MDRSSSNSSCSTSCASAPGGGVVAGQLAAPRACVRVRGHVADPATLSSSSDSIGDDTDASTKVSSVAREAGTIVGGWGGHGRPFGRGVAGCALVALRGAAFLAPSWRVFFAAAFFAGAPSSPAPSSAGGFLAAPSWRWLLSVHVGVGQLVDRPVGQRVQVQLAHLGDPLRQRVKCPVVDRDRREHRNIDRARIHRGRVAGGDDLGVADHDRHDRDARPPSRSGTAPS